MSKPKKPKLPKTALSDLEYKNARSRIDKMEAGTMRAICTRTFTPVDIIRSLFDDETIKDLTTAFRVSYHASPEARYSPLALCQPDYGDDYAYADMFCNFSGLGLLPGNLDVFRWQPHNSLR